MEESLFRQLLSHRANSLLDQATLAKGADYLRHGRVREIRYEADDESGTLFGAIQGREPTPYSAAILIALNGGTPRIDTRCRQRRGRYQRPARCARREYRPAAAVFRSG